MIGAGVIGICTAYFLAAAGHQVAVIERRASVAEEASFGNAGIIAPACLAPWARPGMPRKLLASLFQRRAPFMFRSRANPTLWRWLRLAQPECDSRRYLVNRERMQRVAFYSQQVQHELVGQHQLDYEQTRGVLQLFRTEAEIALNAPARALLASHGVPHELIDASAARRVESALAADTPLAGALHLPDAESGNCALFAKQLRQIAESIGVQFHFLTQVDAIQTDAEHIALRIGAETVQADAVVVAAGAASAQLLRPLGIDIPMYPVRGYSVTFPVRDFEAAPVAALIDDSCNATITRLGARVRIAGLVDLSLHDAAPSEPVLRSLIKVGTDWFPGAASYQSASLWCGARPMLSDGAPLLGHTPVKNLFLNVGHGSAGWLMAAGSGKILSDLISQRSPEIDLEGLTLARYG